MRDRAPEAAVGVGGGLAAHLSTTLPRTANEVLQAQERKLGLSRLKGELIDRARGRRIAPL